MKTTLSFILLLVTIGAGIQASAQKNIQHRYNNFSGKF
jgi:outer membrane lipoprotein-sorting protein